jgi:hypothetical protein
LALIKGFSKFGFENWDDIALKCLVNEKSPAQCREYFELLRCLDPSSPPLAMPDMTAIDATLKDALENTSPVFSAVGYMPLRDEFEVMHANDAESILADMDFFDDPEQGSEWNALKFAVLHNYNRKLDERAARKRFVLDRDLVDFKRVQVAITQHAGSEEDARFMRKIEPLARFARSGVEHMQLVHGLLRERQLRAEVARLQQLRAMGVRTLAEADIRLKMMQKKEELEKQDEPSPVTTTMRLVLEQSPLAAHAGENKLSAEETGFIAKQGISALEYLVVKEALVREHVRTARQHVSLQRVEDLVINSHQVGVPVLEFLVQQGVLPPSSLIKLSPLQAPAQPPPPPPLPEEEEDLEDVAQVFEMSGMVEE